jgi:hypothetical protein
MVSAAAASTSGRTVPVTASTSLIVSPDVSSATGLPFSIRIVTL